VKVSRTVPLGTWRASEADVTYDNEDRQEERDLAKRCIVTITDESIMVSYRWSMGSVVYKGPNDGTGNFALTCSKPSIKGVATLHLVGEQTLTGDFTEQKGEVTGRWTIRLRA
jgi:hypothetical protein